MMEICGVKLQWDVDLVKMNHLVSVLPIEKQQRVRRYIHREDALRTVTADILSRSMICRSLNIKNADIQLVHNEYGKPFLSGVTTKLQFNNSHSGQWAVCALSHAAVGIDVEQISEIDMDIAKHYFSEQEYSDLCDHADDQRLDYFFDLWTLKESYIKAAGMGLSLPLKSFSIRKDNDAIALHTLNELKFCSFKQYPIDSSYKMSVCAQHGEEFPEQVTIRSFDELYEEFMNYL
ncbi:MAG: 4'-phosphopantetheinyl transferase superfamily protein [Candidatus Pristimantibacillus sp.]